MKLSRGLTLLLALVVVTSMAAPALAATAINFNADAAPNPSISTDVTVDTHDRTAMDSPLEYEDNSGNVATLPATVNSSDDVEDIGSGHVNPYAMTATDLDFSDAAEFPRKDDETENSASAIDAGEWTVDESGTAGTATVSDVTTAPGVDAVELSTSSQSSSDVAVFEYTNFSITSDIEKRYVQLVADVSTLDSGAEVVVQAVDSDGDYVEITGANSSLDESSATVLANATGEGDVLQEQVGQLTVEGTGDGTMGEIQTLRVKTSDADATISFSAINLEKTGEWTFGEKYVDSDDDDDLETETITEPHGQYRVNSIESLGATFEEATINGLTFPAKFSASDLEETEENINATFSSADSYPSFDTLFDAKYRLTLPDAYELSYANAALQQTTALPDSRYKSVEVAEGIGDSDWADISSYTSVIDSIGSQGDTVTLDSTIQPGQEIAVHYEALVTGDEQSSLTSTAAGQFGSSDGGLMGIITSPLTWLVGGVAALVGRAKGMI